MRMAPVVHRLLEPAVNVHWYAALVVIWLVILADEG